MVQRCRTPVTKRLCTLMQALLLGVAPAYLLLQQVSAADLAQRSVTVQTSRPSAVAEHTFRFSTQTSATIGSFEFEYCANNPFVGTACTAPAGLDVSSTNLSSEVGITGFSVHSATTSNRIILTRTPSFEAPQSAAYLMSNITNPSTQSATVYVRISTFGSDDATGPRVDSGSVVFSTSGSLQTVGFVPPYITFCTGVTVSGDCSSITGTSLSLGELSSSTARHATSQMAAATNDPSGYSISLSGLTMTSGNNVIPGLANPTASIPGTSQFGVNLRANTSPPVGSNRSGVGTGTPAPDFNIANRFVFKNGLMVSSPLSSDFNVFTVSYIVNISGSQPPGIYVSTITYIATAAF